MARLEFTDASGPKRFELPETGPGVVIGRSPSCHVVVANHSVGRNHGRITFEGGGFAYTDQGSTNGSYVNDRKVAGTVPLSDGDLIVMGEVTIRFVQEARRATASRPAATLRAPDADVAADAPVPRPAEPPRRGTASTPALKSTVEAPRPGDGSDAAMLAEVARLRAENAALRAAPRPAADARGRPDDKAAAALAEREEELRHLRGLVTDSERRVKEAESRAATATASMDGMHKKYLDMRDQVSHLQGLLDAARSEASDREAETAELREKAAALAAQLDAIRGRTGQAAEEVSTLKVKLTEKDREIERLRRDLDGREYDLKSLREESERLEQYVRTDTGRQQDLERKVRNLEAVIDENRNLIASLRRDLEKKDRELREVRLGVGITDLEAEKQRLLDDYHKKSRDLDEASTSLATMNAEKTTLKAERDDLEQRVRVLEDAARARRIEREDISDHPDHRAKVREAESLSEAVRTLTADLDAARRESADLPERNARLAAEAAAANEKARALAQRVDELLAEVARRAAAEAVPVPAPAPEPAVPAPAPAGIPPALSEAVETLSDGLVVLQGTLRDVADVLEALASADAALPAAVREVLAGATPGDLARSLRDVRRLVSEDLEALRTAAQGR